MAFNSSLHCIQSTLHGLCWFRAPILPSNDKRAFTLGGLAVLCWSTVAVGFKLGLTVLTPLQLLLLGSVVSWFVFAIVVLKLRTWTLAKADYPIVILLGLLNPLCYYLVLFAAYDRLPAHIAQPLNYTWAITLAILAVPVLGQKLKRAAIVGILISYLGVVAIILPGDHLSHDLSLTGIILALGSTFLWAGYWLINTRSVSEPTGLMFWSFTLALPLIAILTGWVDGWPQGTYEQWMYGAWVGAIEMGITFLLWLRALRLTSSVARISQLIFFSPFLSLLFIYYVLDEQFGWYVVLGLLLIVAGVALTNRSTSTANAQ